MRLNSILSAFDVEIIPISHRRNPIKNESSVKQEHHDTQYTGKSEDDQPKTVLPNQEPEKIFDRLTMSDSQNDVKSINASDSAITGNSTAIGDSSAILTRRLVAASSQFEVRQIMMEASRELVALRKAMLEGDSATIEMANASIKKLERVLARSIRKIMDLDDEDALRRKQERALHEGDVLRVKELTEEMQRRVFERRRREQGYLRELLQEDGIDGGQFMSSSPLQMNPGLAMETQTATLPDAMVSIGLGVGVFTMGGEGVDVFL
jgi:hypothetical protein